MWVVEEVGRQWARVGALVRQAGEVGDVGGGGGGRLCTCV